MRAPSFTEINENIGSSIKVIDQQKDYLEIEGKLVSIPEHGNAVILGDLHGDIVSVNNIIKDSKLEKNLVKKDVYLICFGDYIDRGPHQVQVLYRLLKLLNKYPEQVTLLRGNHDGPPDIKVSPPDYPTHLYQNYGSRWSFHRVRYFSFIYMGFITVIALCIYASVKIMNNNIVYIGSKPVMNYCTAVLQVMSNNDSVRLMARGRAISQAVDVAEITRNRFLTDLIVDSIEIGTEELESERGEPRNVSNITITLKK